MKLVAGLMLVSSVALANPADDAFDKGRALLADKKYAEACAAFEQSLALDFQFGTLYNIATCDEQIGKLASALKAYRKLARDDVNPTRKNASAASISKLEKRVSKLVIAIAARPNGLHVQLDGNLVDDELNVEIPVDVGSHVVIATEPGKPEVKHAVEIGKEGEMQTVQLALADAPVAEAPTNTRVLVGKITTISGGVVLVGGLVLGGVAISKWHHAQDEAGSDIDQANRDVSSTRTIGNVSTALVVVGAVGVAAGIYLWRSGHGQVAVTPQIGADGAGAMMSGRF